MLRPGAPRLESVLPVWFAHLFGRRGNAWNDRVYLRSFGGTFALGARWWCFSPARVRGDVAKSVEDFPDAFYPAGTDETHARRVLNLVEEQTTWRPAARSALYLCTFSVDLMAQEDASAAQVEGPDEGEDEVDWSPSGLVVAGVPMDAGELNVYLGFLPAEDLELSAVALPLGASGAPVTMLALRWTRPGEGWTYFVLHPFDGTIHGMPAAPVKDWIDWEQEEADRLGK